MPRPIAQTTRYATRKVQSLGFFHEGLSAWPNSSIEVVGQRMLGGWIRELMSAFGLIRALGEVAARWQGQILTQSGLRSWLGNQSEHGIYDVLVQPHQP